MFPIFAILLATIPTLVWGLDQTTYNQNVGRLNSIAYLGIPYNGCVACVNVELADGLKPEISINPDAANVWMFKCCFSKSLGITSPCGDAYGYALGAGSLFFDTDQHIYHLKTSQSPRRRSKSFISIPHSILIYLCNICNVQTRKISADPKLTLKAKPSIAGIPDIQVSAHAPFKQFKFCQSLNS
ncbi:hypothetical protein ACN38_g6170 [Penicillium nordicum]|uniref:Uncharacterized protein n=1 Tax=Penicillium nordicum TaxID=229535 RepID=A0A0M8P8J9_9EURO|nr:hypothetical protein ACN38_g6170 [Penicillium nordicum]